MSCGTTLEKQKPNCRVSKAISFTIRWWKKRDLLIFPSLRILKWKTFMLSKKKKNTFMPSRPENNSIHLCLFHIFYVFCIAVAILKIAFIPPPQTATCFLVFFILFIQKNFMLPFKNVKIRFLISKWHY